MSPAPTLPVSTTTRLQSLAPLPMENALVLKTWFKPGTIEKALALIQKGLTHHFLFFRHAAALTCEDDITATVNITVGTGKHAFVFRDGWCSQCVAGKTGQRCRHVAALSLLCLCEQNNGLRPVTTAFMDSRWQKIGRYLCERLKPGRTTIHWQTTSGATRLSVRRESGLALQVHLHPTAAAEVQGLGITDKHDPPAKLKSILAPLAEQLAQHTATENERALIQRGSTSKQLYRDQSCWMWLTRFLFLQFPEENLTVALDDSDRFVLQSPGQSPLFQLRLARHHSWELLNQLDPESYGFQLQPPAQQFNRVFFNEDGSTLEVENWCRLGDGALHSLAALENQRYGSRYLVKNSLFTLAPVPPEERIDKDGEKILSLFSPSAQTDTKTTGFTVSSDAIPEFLKRNRQALGAARHQVEPEILELEVVSEPESLQLTDFQEDMDWCYLAGYYDLGNQKIDFTDLFQATTDNRQYIAGRQWFDLHNSSLEWFHKLGSERLTENGLIRLTHSELLLLGTQVSALNTDTRAAHQGRMLSFLQGNEKDEESIPLNDRQCNHLRDYQVHGVNWLFKLQKHGFGGILADDMGLGKTHQALALIDLSREETDRFLIVCPAAVLYHWPEKQQTFFPHLSMSVYHGPRRDLEQAGESRIIVTTYGILRQDIDELGLIPFKLVIFDEMHHLKNKKTSTFKAAGLLLSGTTFGLTGTPVENNIRELETLLTLCLPDLFSSPRIHRMFKEADSSKERQTLQRLVAPFILRRTRKQVLKELPALSEDIRLCELSDDQVAAYRQAVEQATDVVDDLLSDEPLSDYTHILTTIIRLKQICNHLCQLEQCTDWARYKSGKWDEFTRMLRQCLQSNLKVVVFSQFTTMLDIIESWLQAEKIDHVSLRGKVGARERSKRITRFNKVKKCRVCCASLLAGGTGIDLTGAQVVIHFDRWWNPAKEEQATARVHRMGQRHPVQVYKLVTAGTLEEKIHTLIEQKRALAAELIVEDDGSILKTLNRKELAELFRYG